jgi:hypothetical protein
VPKPRAFFAGSTAVSINTLLAPSANASHHHGTPTSRAQPTHYTARGSQPSEPLGEHERVALRQALLRDVVVPGTARAKASSWATWQYYHQRWHGTDEPTLPLTPTKIEAVAAQMKAQGYRSFPNFLSAVREKHVDAGHIWTSDLERSRKQCVASTQRGIGPPRQCVEIPPSRVCGLGLGADPVVEGGPICPGHWATLCAFHILRGAESASALATSLTVDPESERETWWLPSSKTDTQAAGCVRTWGCVCADPTSYTCITPCPYHAAVCLQMDLARRFGDSRGRLPADLPLFPAADGSWCTRVGFISTIVHMATQLDIELIDPMGRFTAGEHVWRVSGSRMLARAGIPVDKIMLVARWGSDIVHRYIAESPLTNIALEYKRGSAVTMPQPSNTNSADDDRIAEAEATMQLPDLPITTPAWTHAAKDIVPDPPQAQTALCRELTADRHSMKMRPNFAENTSTAFLHIIARRQAWERPMPGRTVCGQDHLIRNYAQHHYIPPHCKKCTKCANAENWASLVNINSDSESHDSRSE